MTVHKVLENVGYGTSGGLVASGSLMQYLPSADTTSIIAQWVGIITGIVIAVATIYYKRRNSKLYDRALQKGYVNAPSDKD